MCWDSSKAGHRAGSRRTKPYLWNCQATGHREPDVDHIMPGSDRGRENKSRESFQKEARWCRKSPRLMPQWREWWSLGSTDEAGGEVPAAGSALGREVCPLQKPGIDIVTLVCWVLFFFFEELPIHLDAW